MDVNQDYVAKLVERHQKQLERVRKYNKEHRDELNAKSKEYFKKLKEDPEKYKVYLEAKRAKYKEQNPKQVLPVKVFE
jgi:uncharacterized protein YeaO (DUF488 family)